MFSKTIIFIFFNLIFSSYSYSIQVCTLKYLSLHAVIKKIKHDARTQESIASSLPADLAEYVPLMLKLDAHTHPNAIKIIDGLLSGTQSITDIQLPFEVIKTGCIPLLEFLFSKGISVDAADNLGLTLLMTAVNFKHKDMVRFLLNSGACPDKRDILNRTALQYAELHKNQEIQNLLKYNGIKKRLGFLIFL